MKFTKEQKEFFKKFHQHGLECGEIIEEILKKRHPKATVYPLYRTAIAIEREGEQVHLYTAGDPHVWGLEITDKNLREDHYLITGDRFGPRFYLLYGDGYFDVSVDYNLGKSLKEKDE